MIDCIYVTLGCRPKKHSVGEGDDSHEATQSADSTAVAGSISGGVFIYQLFVQTIVFIQTILH